MNFVKTDAVSSKRDGVDYYTLSFDIEVEGIQDGAGKYDDGVLMVPGHYLNICQRQGKDAEVMSFAVSNRLSRDNCFVFPVEKGHRYKVENNRRLKSMTLAKHESGWVVVEQ